MESRYVFELDSCPVRFTPDGKVAVMDAIRAVSLTPFPGKVWGRLKRAHPQLPQECEEYRFDGGKPILVADSETWQRIWNVLSDHL
jgi:hypothetical protein